jgi:hypothetical protein
MPCVGVVSTSPTPSENVPITSRAVPTGTVSGGASADYSDRIDPNMADSPFHDINLELTTPSLPSLATIPTASFTIPVYADNDYPSVPIAENVPLPTGEVEYITDLATQYFDESVTIENIVVTVPTIPDISVDDYNALFPILDAEIPVGVDWNYTEFEMILITLAESLLDSSSEGTGRMEGLLYRIWDKGIDLATLLGWESTTTTHYENELKYGNSLLLSDLASAKAQRQLDLLKAKIRAKVEQAKMQTEMNTGKISLEQSFCSSVVENFVSAYKSELAKYVAYIIGQSLVVEKYITDLETITVRMDAIKRLIKISKEYENLSLSAVKYYNTAVDIVLGLVEIYRQNVNIFEEAVKANEANLEIYRILINAFERSASDESEKASWDSYRIRGLTKMLRGELPELWRENASEEITAFSDKIEALQIRSDAELASVEAKLNFLVGYGDVFSTLTKAETEAFLAHMDKLYYDASSRIEGRALDVSLEAVRISAMPTMLNADIRAAVSSAQAMIDSAVQGAAVGQARVTAAGIEASGETDAARSMADARLYSTLVESLA